MLCKNGALKIFVQNLRTAASAVIIDLTNPSPVICHQLCSIIYITWDLPYYFFKYFICEFIH